MGTSKVGVGRFLENILGLDAKSNDASVIGRNGLEHKIQKEQR
jgi:hypothetical protein